MKPFCLGLIWCFLLALVAVGMSGCASTEDSQNASVRPWNAPQGWENGLPSTMTEGR